MVTLKFFWFARPAVRRLRIQLGAGPMSLVLTEPATSQLLNRLLSALTGKAKGIENQIKGSYPSLGGSRSLGAVVQMCVCVCLPLPLPLPQECLNKTSAAKYFVLMTVGQPLF